MKKIGVLIAAALTLAACHRKEEPNKIIDGFGAGSNEVVIPAEAAQQYLLLKRDLLHILMPAITKFPLNDSTFSELTPAGGMKYSFQSSERHYGTATFLLEFRDEGGTTIDPIAVRGSTTTLKTIVVTGNASSNEFPSGISENLTLVFESSGSVTSTLRMTGTSVFTGSSYTLTFNLAAPGSKAIFEALTDGTATVSGTGGTPPAPATLNLDFRSDHSVNGAVAWEGREGGFHLETNGSGFVVEPAGRILLD